MRKDSLDINDIEKLFLRADACYLESIESQVGFHFVMKHADGGKVTVPTFYLSNEQINKLRDLLSDIGCEILMTKDNVTIESKGSYRISKHTLEDAIVGWLNVNWYLEAPEPQYRLIPFSTRKEIKKILLGEE